MTFITNIIKGIFIGIGGIAPGVSGGTFAMMLGVYDKITDAIGNFYKDFKNKFIFLTSIGIGVAIGIVGFSRVLDLLFSTYEIITKLTFIGIMLGSLPSLFKESNKNGFRKRYLLPMFITLSVTIVFGYLDNSNMNGPVSSVDTITFSESALYGGVIALGSIIPGVSSSIMLMYAGVYGTVLNAISTIQLSVLIPMGIGFCLTILVLSKGIHYLFKHYFGWTSYMVLGFIIGSAVALMPTSNDYKTLAIGLFLAAAGAVATHFVSVKLIKFES